ncbi:hypothetical protein [Nocardioides speluncae]|uniref:hypothetical protein n=1 Tax=Nocardioides speluncae TaxID=2670337 RepID=UPI000D68D88E|nr:hypothetical protein [Nocardioides speluncae]
MRLRAVLIAVPLAVIGLAVPAYAEPTVTVDWGTTSEFNADYYGYTFQITDAVAEPERGTLYAEWQGERQAIPHNGRYTMDFVTGGIGTVKIVRCVGEPEICTDTGAISPTIEVFKYASLDVEDFDDWLLRDGAQTAQLRSWDSRMRGATVDLTWYVRLGEEGEPASSGTAQVVVGDNDRASLPFTISKTTTGYQELWIEGTVDIGSFGRHRVRGHTEHFEVDATAPRVWTGASATAVYPVRDGYRDSINLKATTNEWTSGRLEILRGSSMLRRIWLTDRSDHVVRYDGRSSSGKVLAAGTYTARFTLKDRVGHEVTASRSFTVSGKRLVTRHFRRTYSAASTVVRNGATVGRCSTLAKPSARGWAGSLGFYSQTKCRRLNDSLVATVNGVYVPKSVQARYGKLRVTMYGGGATRGVRHGRNAYIVMSYINRADDFAARAQFNGSLGQHAGRTVNAGGFVWKKTTKPYVLWFTGLTEGSNYDVKSYTVDLDYTVLR